MQVELTPQEKDILMEVLDLPTEYTTDLTFGLRPDGCLLIHAQWKSGTVSIPSGYVIDLRRGLVR